MLALRDKQVAAISYLTLPEFWNITDVAFGGAAEGGKSFIAAVWLLSMCNDVDNPNLYYAACAYDIEKSKNSIMNKINEVAEIMGLKKDIDYTYNKHEHQFYFKNTGSRILLFGLANRAGDPQHSWLRGYEFTGAWIDESDTIDKDIIAAFSLRCGRTNNMKKILTSNMTDEEKIEHPEYKKYGGYEKMVVPKKILQTFNPTRKHPYEKFYVPWRDKTETDTIFIRSWIYDNYPPNHPRILEWEQHPEGRVKEQMFYGNFDVSDSDMAMFQHEEVKRIFDGEDVKTGIFYMIVDVASITKKDKKDETTIAIFDGLDCIHLEEMKGDRSLEDYISYLKAVREKYSVSNQNMVIDSNGMGEMIAASKEFVGCKMYIAHTSAIVNRGGLTNKYRMKQNTLVKSEERVYGSIKDQCMMELVEKVNDGKVKASFKDKKLLDYLETELLAYELQPNERGLIIVKSKRDMRKLLGRSTDTSDLFQMRMYIELLDEHITPSRSWEERKFTQLKQILEDYE